MYKVDDFRIERDQFYVKNDVYPLSRVHDIEIKCLSIREKLFKTLCWMSIASSLLWLAWDTNYPNWYYWIALASVLMGIGFGVYFGAKYELRIEFALNDGTGLHWVPVAKCHDEQCLELFERQVAEVQAAITKYLIT